MNFDEAFVKLMGHEGGYVNHPSDPGGETNWGITKRVAEAHGYTGPMRELTQDKAKEIARAAYWNAVSAESLPHALRYPVFDAAYHSGPRQSIRWLQRALGAVDDGIVGRQTLTIAHQADPYKTRSRMLGERLEFLAGLSTWPAFGRGWSRRIASLLEET